MKTDVKIYNVKDFIRKTVSGEIDLEKSMQLAKDFADIAYLHNNHNLLLDMRDTTISDINMTDLMKVVLKITSHLHDFKNKIANVIPDNQERLQIARQFQSCMVLKGFSYEIFTDFEEALDWLSETTNVYKK